MKRFLKKRKMRGFTLVELLIVIIIIGILAGALLLVAGAGTDKANATKVVSDMRTIKASAIMKYADDGTWTFAAGTGNIDEIRPYSDRDVSNATVASYDIVTSGVSGHTDEVFVEAKNIISGASDKLITMAEDNGLLSAASSSADVFDGTGTVMYLQIR